MTATQDSPIIAALRLADKAGLEIADLIVAAEINADEGGDLDGLAETIIATIEAHKALFARRSAGDAGQ
jgi:ribosomal protein L22